MGISSTYTHTGAHVLYTHVFTSKCRGYRLTAGVQTEEFKLRIELRARDGSVFKNTCCSADNPAPIGDPSSVTPSDGASDVFSDLCKHQAHTHTNKTLRHAK